MKGWVSSLDKIDVETQRTTLKRLLEKFQDIRQGMSKSTRDTELTSCTLRQPGRAAPRPVTKTMGMQTSGNKG